MPSRPRPVVVIGAGGIVRDAHLPAYRMAGFPVAGICDLERSKAEALAAEYHIPRVWDRAADAVSEAPADAVFDIALPPSQSLPTLELLPDGATVLVQKPMAETLEGARALRDRCHAKGLTAAINHQLRFAPYCLAARDLIGRGLIGDVHAMEVRIVCYTPGTCGLFWRGRRGSRSRCTRSTTST